MAYLGHLTHTFHRQLKVPDGIDLVIHSGDCSNPRDLVFSQREIEEFIQWYKDLPIPHKVYVAGNHDLAIEKNRVTPADFALADITYLQNELVTIQGFRIWGSPITPTFGIGWAFNKARDKIYNVWNSIPDDIDILITHGPAKGILDYTFSREGILEQCGCANLKKRIFELAPKLFCFGHIHDCQGIENAGYTKLSSLPTIFSNGSVVMDGRFEYGAVHNGNVFELEKEDESTNKEVE